MLNEVIERDLVVNNLFKNLIVDGKKSSLPFIRTTIGGRWNTFNCSFQLYLASCRKRAHTDNKRTVCKTIRNRYDQIEF